MTMKVEDEIRRASRPADNVKVGDMVSGSVYNLQNKVLLSSQTNALSLF